MDELHHSDERRALQDRFDTRRLADRLAEKVFHQQFTEGDRFFVHNAMFFFLATTDAHGQPQCSYKGGPRGFVHVTGPSEFVFPFYEGNGLYMSAGNVAETAKVGMLFIDFEKQTRMRVNGVATLIDDHPVMRDTVAAQLIVRVQVSDIHPNCPRNVHKMALVEPSGYTPKSASDDVGKAPWTKRFSDVLPEAMKPDHLK